MMLRKNSIVDKNEVPISDTVETHLNLKHGCILLLRGSYSAYSSVVPTI